MKRTGLCQSEEEQLAFYCSWSWRLSGHGWCWFNDVHDAQCAEMVACRKALEAASANGMITW
jgi:hypothetical protein